jgi:cytochrome P450
MGATSDAVGAGRECPMTAGQTECHIEGTTPITEFREIDEILRSNAFVQAAYGHAVQPLVHDTLTAIDGPRHAMRTRLENKLFTRDAIAHYKREAVEPLLRGELAELRRQRRPDGSVEADLVPLIWRIARRVPAFVVGIDGVDDTDRVERFVELLATLGHGLSASLSPHRDELVASALKARARFATEFFLPSAARRRELVARDQRGELDPAELPRDLITLQLANWQDDWDDELLLREAAMFLSASITTTAQSFPHFIVHVTNWADANPDKAHLLRDIDFLQRAVAEALRFFVASPARLRMATTDVTLRSGRRVAAGERVSLWFLPANLDPDEFGSDAATFDPLRETGKKVPWGLAFGQGAHVCIGKNLITGARDRSPDDSGDPLDVAHGIPATVAHALFQAGMTIDPTRPANKHPTSIYDEYTSLPVRFNV